MSEPHIGKEFYDSSDYFEGGTEHLTDVHSPFQRYRVRKVLELYAPGPVVDNHHASHFLQQAVKTRDNAHIGKIGDDESADPGGLSAAGHWRTRGTSSSPLPSWPIAAASWPPTAAGVNLATRASW